MKIIISEEAANWYEKELDLNKDDTVRFFVRYGGVGGRIPGFSLGVNNDLPDQVHTSTKVHELTFFIEEDDAWYFEDNNLIVTLDKELEEPQFTYE